MDRMNQIGSMWTELDQCGLNMIELDRIGPMWIEKDLIKLKWTEEGIMDRIGLLNIYNFYHIFRAHISNF